MESSQYVQIFMDLQKDNSQYKKTNSQIGTLRPKPTSMPSAATKDWGTSCI
ncbi:MAG: hypothetical protein U5L00_06480 [Desulfovermiculus sp.]|nr:hypothetical protein [Desulfovermiculus sp.]